MVSIHRCQCLEVTFCYCLKFVFFMQFSDILLIAGITAHGRYRVHKKMALKTLLVSAIQVRYVIRMYYIEPYHS